MSGFSDFNLSEGYLYDKYVIVDGVEACLFQFELTVYQKKGYYIELY